MAIKESELVGTRSGDSTQFDHIDHIEFYVGNAHQAAHYFRTAFGFKPTAYAGMETGLRDRVSILVEQGDIRFVLTAPLVPDGPIAHHVMLHGDGVRDIAFAVEDAERAFNETVGRGARPLLEPTAFEENGGRLVKATVGAFGDTVHTFVQREQGDGSFFPNFRPVENAPQTQPTGLTAIDHVAVTVERGSLNELVDFYNRVMGFHQSHQEDISTDYSGMNSKVVQNRRGPIKFPIMEPADGRRKSQIEEYLAYYNGPGAQHLAVSTDDIVGTVRQLRANGIEFLRTPASYYDTLEQRVGKIDEDVEALREQNILVDLDDSGYLMQIFSKPLHSRPTLFLEIIQRRGARGFGGGNIKALFEAVEREQARRGNL